MSNLAVVYNCPIVGHSPGFNCIGPRGASKNFGLGWTSGIPSLAPTEVGTMLSAVSTQYAGPVCMSRCLEPYELQSAYPKHLALSIF